MRVHSSLISVPACLLALFFFLAPARAQVTAAQALWTASTFGAVAAYSPDGTRLAVTQGFGQIVVYRASDHTLLFTLHGHTNLVRTLAFSPNGDYLISGGDDKVLRLWRLDDGAQVGTMVGCTKAVHTAAFSPDGTAVTASCGDGIVRTWGLSNSRLRYTIPYQEELGTPVAYASDGQTLITVGWVKPDAYARCVVDLRDARDGSLRTRVLVQEKAILNLVPLPGGLFGINDGTTFSIYAESTGAVTRMLRGSTGEFSQLTVAPNGRYLASFSTDTLKLWSTETGLQYASLPMTDYQAGAYTPDGTRLAVISHGLMRFIATDSGEVVDTLYAPENDSTAMAISPDNRTVLVGTSTGAVAFHDGLTGKALAKKITLAGAVRGIAISPDGQYAAMVDSTNVITLWSLQQTSQPVWTGESGHHATTLAFSPDGYTLASAGIGIILWNVSDGTIRHSLMAHTGMVTSLSFSTDGALLASGSEDCTVRIWETATGTALKTLDGFTKDVMAVALSPDGSVVAAGGKDQQLRLWQVADGQPVKTAKYAGMYPVRALVFSPDGQQLVTAGGYNGGYDASLWLLQSDAPQRIFRGYLNTPSVIALSPNGRRLLLGGKDGIGVFAFTTLQPDGMGRAAGETAFHGSGLYTVTDEPTVTQTAESDNPATYVLRWQNDGTKQDTFLLTAQGSGEGWTIRYFDAPQGGTDITERLTGDGYLLTLPTDGYWDFRAEVTPSPAVPGNMPVLITMTGTSLGDDTKSDTVVVETVKAALTAVRITMATAGPYPVNTPIRVSAEAVGGGPVEYHFCILRSVDGAWTTIATREYAADPNYTWVPDEPGTYQLQTSARELASGDVVTQTADCDVTPTLSAVTVSATPATVQPVGTTVTLKATPTGGAHVLYKFAVWYKDGESWRHEVVQDKSALSTCTWTPTAPGTYVIRVEAYESDGATPVVGTTRVTVVPALSGVALSAEQAESCMLGSSVTLTATATGGARISYQIRAGRMVNGQLLWTVVKPWGMLRTCTWTPTEPGRYTLQVIAREADCSAVTYATLAYRVAAAPITDLVFTTQPTRLVAVNTPVPLAVSTTQPYAEFYFRVGLRTDHGLQWTTLQRYNPQATCTWTPDVPGQYTIQVQARTPGSADPYEMYVLAPCTVR